jgi:hypothetical protein
MKRDWWGEKSKNTVKPTLGFCSNRMKILATLFLATLLCGCSAGSVYEGVRQRETVKNVPPEPAPAPQLPSYQDYEAERKKLQGAQ